jgi:hypothetical protein
VRLPKELKRKCNPENLIKAYDDCGDVADGMSDGAKTVAFGSLCYPRDGRQDAYKRRWECPSYLGVRCQDQVPKGLPTLSSTSPLGHHRRHVSASAGCAQQLASPSTGPCRFKLITGRLPGWGSSGETHPRPRGE